MKKTSSLGDIAKHAGVSAATVSRIVREELSVDAAQAAPLYLIEARAYRGVILKGVTRAGPRNNLVHFPPGWQA